MNETAIGVVCDAGPLIHLDELNSLWLLNDFVPALVPGQVWQEVSQHRPRALSSVDVSSLQKIDVVISTAPAFRTLTQSLSLDLGEQAALTLMQDHPHAIFLWDNDRSVTAAFKRKAWCRS